MTAPEPLTPAELAAGTDLSRAHDELSAAISAEPPDPDAIERALARLQVHLSRFPAIPTSTEGGAA